jgi:hypothetical protein
MGDILRICEAKRHREKEEHRRLTDGYAAT